MKHRLLEGSSCSQRCCIWKTCVGVALYGGKHGEDKPTQIKKYDGKLEAKMPGKVVGRGYRIMCVFNDTQCLPLYIPPMNPCSRTPLRENKSERESL